MLPCNLQEQLWPHPCFAPSFLQQLFGSSVGSAAHCINGGFAPGPFVLQPAYPERNVASGVHNYYRVGGKERCLVEGIGLCIRVSKEEDGTIWHQPRLACGALTGSTYATLPTVLWCGRPRRPGRAPVGSKLALAVS